ncbi:hypothetical protein CDN99_13490 [Roseateles aquatilis]|uniref:Uncharacterized protein n=1 Tax=Roseateles aquatilis TaxID=431061 RepID=A0A246JCZ2_9BURK|nr:hypothetical protein CDN99_13490 [Roseateles aquatilis]
MAGALAIVVGIAGATAAWLTFGDGTVDAGDSTAAAPPARPASSPRPGPLVAGGGTSASAASSPGGIAPSTPTVAESPPAHWSLADARVAGDDRSPPMQRSTAEPPTPTWQLDDHASYARRERQRHQDVQRAFVAAADQELPMLDAQIERGRAMGLSPEQLAKGEEKRRRIAQMRDRMQAALAASGATP